MRKIHLIFLAIFFAIAIPVVILLAHSYSQLQKNAQYAYKEHAFLVQQMLNQRINDDIAIEDQRSYSEYRFIRAVPVIGGEEITLSDLANFPIVGHSNLIRMVRFVPQSSRMEYLKKFPWRIEASAKLYFIKYRQFS